MSQGLEEFFNRFRNERLGVLIDTSVPGDTRGAIVSPAAVITPAIVNRIASLSPALFFTALSSDRAEAFNLQRMTRTQHRPENQNHSPLDMYVSVEARSGVTTGISAYDRSVTIAIIGEETPHPRKLVSPGHIFPVVTKTGGLLVKTALPEAALDTVVHAGFTDAACFVDLLDDAGNFLSKDALLSLCQKEDIPYLFVDDLTSFLLQQRSLVEKVSEARLPTEFAGEVTAITFRSLIHSGEHLVLVKGDIRSDEPVLTRVQTEATLHDVFGGGGRRQKQQIHKALKAIGNEGRGVFVYLRKPTSGSITHDLLPPTELSPPKMDLMREYGIGAQILHHMGVSRIRLLAGTTRNLIGLNAFGIEIVEQVPL